MNWDFAAEELLRSRVNEGEFASKIGKEFGCTRNAILGKMWRMGLRSKNTREDGPNARRAAAPQPQRVTKFQRRSPRPTLTMVEAVATLDPAEVPTDQRKTLTELTEHTCRWPYGDVGEEGFFFCGAESDRKTYCARHTAVAWSPGRRR